MWQVLSFISGRLVFFFFFPYKRLAGSSWQGVISAPLKWKDGALTLQHGRANLAPCSPSKGDNGHCSKPGGGSLPCKLCIQCLARLGTALPVDTWGGHVATALQNTLSVKLWLSRPCLRWWWLISMEVAFQEKICTHSFILTRLCIFICT